MAVSSSKAGRPYRVADISFAKDPDRELYNQFHEVCRSLSYYDTVIVARACRVDVRTVRRWQTGESFPGRRGTAVLVIDWVNRGKPRKEITQAELAASMV